MGITRLTSALYGVLSVGIATAAVAELKYPETRQVDQKDNYHGTVVADPYRWLENDVRQSSEVKDWVKAQNKVTHAYLDTLPYRDRIQSRMRTLWDFEKYGTPKVAKGRYFYTKNDGLQNQSAYYYQDGLNAPAKLVLDPNTWSKDGTIALAQTQPSPNGRYVAYGIQESGSDWRTWKIKDLNTGKTFDESLKWLKFTSVSWSKDNKGFYYSRYPTPEKGQRFQSLNKNQKVYFHALGTPQQHDKLVYERPDQPEWGFASQVTDDGQFLLITIWRGTDDRYQLVYIDLSQQPQKPVQLVNEFKYDFSLLGNTGKRFLFKTTQNAPRGKVIAIDLDKPKESQWQTVIAERDEVLDDANWIGRTGKI